MQMIIRVFFSLKKKEPRKVINNSAYFLNKEGKKAFMIRPLAVLSVPKTP